MRRIAVHILVFALLVPISGCGWSTGAPYVEGSQDEATVKGTVKIKGKAAPGGILHFNASNSKRMVPTRDAEVQPDGSYTLKAYVGQNIVTLSPPRKNRHDIKNRDYFGLEYADEYIEVKAGEENQFDLNLNP